jgi:rod shape-determining protein MreB
MTGGTSQLKNLDKLIAMQTGVSVKVADNALYCVVNGTGVLLEHLDQYQRSILAKK